MLALAAWVAPAGAMAPEAIPPSPLAQSPEPKSETPAMAQFDTLQSLVGAGAEVSALAVALESGKTLAALSPDKALIPASVTKLVLAAALLDRFGPEHTFVTRVLVDGRVSSSGTTLDGDLIIDAAGEPGLTNEYLWRLATDVARLGLREVAGELVLNTSRFSQIAPEARDINRLAGLGASAHAYDSPLSAGAVNYSVLGVFVAPGPKPGARARVALEPYPLRHTELVNEVRTVGASEKTQLNVMRTTRDGRDVLKAAGTIAVGDTPRTVYRSVSDPDRYALDVFEAFLKAAGVTVRSARRSQDAAPSGREVLRLESQPLEWQLRGLLRQSNNFVADMLTIQLDPAPKGKSLAAGTEELAAYLTRVARSESVGLAGASRASSASRLASGSGLTPSSRLSAEAVVKVLQNVYRRDDHFGHLYAALPGAGSEGTLKRRFEGNGGEWLAGRLRAKTGTLTSPVLAIGLAGFCRTQSGQWVAFGIMVNGAPGARGLSVARVRDAIEADIGRILKVL